VLVPNSYSHLLWLTILFGTPIATEETFRSSQYSPYCVFLSNSLRLRTAGRSSTLSFPPPQWLVSSFNCFIIIIAFLLVVGIFVFAAGYINTPDGIFSSWFLFSHVFFSPVLATLFFFNWSFSFFSFSFWVLCIFRENSKFHCNMSVLHHGFSICVDSFACLLFPHRIFLSSSSLLFTNNLFNYSWNSPDC